MLPSGCDYPEIKEDWIANTHKMAKAINFRPTVADKSKLEGYLYFSPIDQHFIWDFHLTK